jgi:SAM-dependent methyltransferase
VIGRLPQPLDASFAEVLRDVAREYRLPAFDDPKMPELVRAMAAVYNDDKLKGLGGTRDQLAARLGFWFPRDVPKMAGAVRELVAMGRVGLKVLDFGAGLGASHRGLARALEAGVLDVTATDADKEALKIAVSIAKRAPREGNVEIKLRVADSVPRGPFDVILIGQVITELDVNKTPEERLQLHADRITGLARFVAKDGIIVIVEPALRPRSRHLQRLRTPLIAAGLHVLAPCLHHGECPLLPREGDWCHEDLPVDLPEFLVPVAKKAGLRWEGLTFSYLAVSPKPPRLVDRLVAPHRERVVSSLLVTKGKREVILCGDPLVGELHGTRVGRLDRAASESNEAFDSLGRGDIITLGPLDEKLRVGPDGTVKHLELTSPPHSPPQPQA